MRRSFFAIFFFAAMLTVAGPASSDDERRLPGHSHQGEVFDRGPRQSAYLMKGTGRVHFPVTTKNPLVQQFIDQGVGQLHGFSYFEAERSFRKAASLDPDCGIAYWGASIACQFNKIRAKQFAEIAGKHKKGLTEREQMFIDAMVADSSYRPIIEKYPKDLEAKAFEVWRIWHKAEAGSSVPGGLEANIKFAKEILRIDPMHPIHHAVIHMTDATDSESQGLESAARCGDAAPSIGHMWHMPTHIYFNLQRYPEAAWQLEASIRTDHARMMHDRIIPDQVPFYAHNNEWLVRTLLYLGRFHDARRTAMNMIDRPRHPLLNLVEPPVGSEKVESEDDLRTKERPVEVHGTSAYYGRDRLLQTLRQYESWDELIDVCKSHYIEPTAIPGEQAKVLMNLGVAYYSKGDVAEGDGQLEKIRQLRNAEIAELEAVIGKFHKGPKQNVKELNILKSRIGSSAALMKNSLTELESYHWITTGFFLSRNMLVACLSVLFVGELIVFWFLRRRMILAIFSVLAVIGIGGWLFQRHLNLLNLPWDCTNVDFAFMSRKQLDAGDPDVAEWCAREFAKNRVKQVRPQANLVEILYRVGKKDDARAEFETLRELAGTADLDSPPLARLAPIAREFGFPTDWRRPGKIQNALSARRRLPSLGPLVWRPWTAPDWALKDAKGSEHTLAEFRGKPVILVFFLGEGCLHCKQQLEAFVKQAKDFSEAGVTVVAISSDDQAGIKKSLESYKPGPFPFLMLADPKMKVFQSYRTYDDFEEIGLHGTFLIDPQGLGRWQDVAAEPFMDIDFVLAESKRLLSCEVAPVEPGAHVIVDVPLPAVPSSTTVSGRR